MVLVSPVSASWSPPRILDGLAVYNLGAGPALRRSKNDHRPSGKLRMSLKSRAMLDGMYFRDYGIERAGHEWVHEFRIAALDKIRLVTVSPKKLREFFIVHPAQNRGI